MKFLLRNYSQFKKKLSQISSKIQPRDFPLFCLIMGYMLTKIQNFDLLSQTIELAISLVSQDKLPETEMFQWLMFIYDKPERMDDGIAFIENIKNQQNIDVYDEIQNLYTSEKYQKKSLSSQNRYNSIDTVVIENQNQQRQKQFGDDFQKIKIQQQNQKQFDNQSFKKMQDDEQFARKIQQQQQQLARQYKSKMKQQQTMCQICYVDLYEGVPSFLDKCGHGFHQECLIQSFKAQISENNFPLKCPNQQCKHQCLQNDVKLILPEDIYKKYQDHTLKAYADMHGDSVSWCPTADCGYMFFFQKDDQVRFQCLQCKKQYCLNCRCDWHKDMTCAEYKVSTTVSQQDKMFLDFVKGKKFKQCPKCKFWVQKNQGCDHMTCKCKFQFCYKCGGVYMKCECIQKARQQMLRRQNQRQQARRRKQQKLQKKARELKQKQQRGQSPVVPKRTRAKRGGKI